MFDVGGPAFLFPGLVVPEHVSEPVHQVLAVLVAAPVVMYLAGLEAEGGVPSAAEPALGLGARCSAAPVEQVHVEPAQLHWGVRVHVREDLFVVLVPKATDETKVVTAFVAEKVAPVEAFLECLSGVLEAVSLVLAEVVDVGEPLGADVALLGQAQLISPGSVVSGHNHV